MTQTTPNTTRSAELFGRATQLLPGGVSSPVRAYRSVGGTPRVIERASGARITDVDGNDLLDFVGSWGPLVLGHAHPAVLAAISLAAERGTTFGAPTPFEIDLAERVIAMHPALERVRFVSSGTEAVMSAVRTARGYTGRDLILKFSGCYHGHADHLLVAAGSGLATFGTPSSAGVPAAFAAQTAILPLDDTQALEAFFAERGDVLACALIEPAPANNGLLLQRPAFLARLRELCTQHGALLLFDEVITGFRLGPGGYSAQCGITPDLATFGKVIGGGLPVGAFGGPAEIMAVLSPDGPVYQAGTLSGNPVAMAAGLATLDQLERAGGWQTLETLGEYLAATLSPVLDRHRARLVRLGSIFWISFTDTEAPRSAETIRADAIDSYPYIFHALLARGIALAPSAYEVGFLSTAHTTADLDHFAATLDEVLSEAAER
jgi:glutamate-1-semialdehyde 2,1-aminomutase